MPAIKPTLIDNPDEHLAAAKIAVGGGGALLYGLTLNEWVAILTIAYMVLQIGLLLPKYYGMIKKWLSKDR